MKVLGIVGSYRKNGVIDSIVTAILDEASRLGSETEKIYLNDVRIEFCTNCRQCTQTVGKERGNCPINDDMALLLDKYDNSDALVIGAPVNFFALNALTKKFMERLIPFSYWPWGAKTGPRPRTYKRAKKSILISSCAMPGFAARFISSSMRSLRLLSRVIGAKPVGTIFAGLSAVNENDTARNSHIKKALKLTRKLF